MGTDLEGTDLPLSGAEPMVISALNQGNCSCQ